MAPTATRPEANQESVYMQAGADKHLHAELATVPCTEFSFSPDWTSGAVLGANVSPTFVGASVFELTQYPDVQSKVLAALLK